MRRTILLAAGVAALLAILPATVHGQRASARQTGWPEASRYLDYFVSHYRPAEPAGGHGAMDGVGGRLMWSLASLTGGEREPWSRRTLLGGYLTHSPSSDESLEMWRLGAQADVLISRAPLVERVFPFLSLGVGAVRVEEAGWGSTVPPLLRANPVRGRVATHLSLTPGVGARIQLAPGVGLRGDARQVIDFRDGIRNNFEVSGGITVSG